MPTKKPTKDWNPKDDEKRWIIQEDGSVDWWHNFDKGVEFGNYFRTRPLALSAAKEVKKLLKGMKHG